MHYYRQLKHGDLNYERVYTRAERKICSVENCTRLVTGRGWCANHYYYWRTHGTVDHIPHGRPEDRFWAKVDRSGDCWMWTAGRDRNGYGVFRHEARQWRAPRVAWTFTYGDIPAGLVVMHSCDNPPCVNPAHLSLGTSGDNARDAARKGRMGKRTIV